MANKMDRVLRVRQPAPWSEDSVDSRGQCPTRDATCPRFAGCQ